MEVKRSLESPAPNGAPGAVCGRWRRGRRRLRRRWRVRPQQGGPGVSWCVPSVCGSACIAHCICSARRSPSSSCARFCAPGRTHRPPAAHQAPAFFARAAAAVRGFALHAGAAGPPPSAYQTRPAKRLHCVPAFRPVFARSPRAVSDFCRQSVTATCYFTVPVLRQARNASTQQQTGTGATNSWLFCCPRGHRFAAAAAIPDGRATLSRAA